jgi:hypothetical protein
MAGVTYQITTDQYDMGSINQVVVSEFAVSYVADDGAVHHLVFQPETRLASDVGAIDDGTVPSGLFDPMMAIGLIVIILMAVLIFMIFRRQKKKE